jgi:diaminopimelate epimerase
MEYSAVNEHQVGYILMVMNIKSNGKYKLSVNYKIYVVQIGVPHCITDL